MNHDAEVRALATLKRFLLDSEIPVRELAELAFANCIAARSFARMSASEANGHFSPI
jgi:hypothetical protein